MKMKVKNNLIQIKINNNNNNILNRNKKHRKKNMQHLDAK